MGTNTEALELLRQIAADTRATREAVEAQTQPGPAQPRPELDTEQAERLGRIVAQAMEGRAKADYVALMGVR